eukprot:tig00000147_g9465.t1
MRGAWVAVLLAAALLASAASPGSAERRAEREAGDAKLTSSRRLVAEATQQPAPAEACTAPREVLERSKASLSSSDVHVYSLHVKPGTARLSIALTALEGGKPYARVRFGGIPAPASQVRPTSGFTQQAAPVALVQGEARLDWPREGQWLVTVSYEKEWDKFNAHQWIAPGDAGRYELRVEALVCGEGFGGDCNCSTPIHDLAPGAPVPLPDGVPASLFRAAVPPDPLERLSVRIAPATPGSFIASLRAPTAPSALPALEWPRCPPGFAGAACAARLLPLAEGEPARAEAPGGGALLLRAEVAPASVGFALRLTLLLAGADPPSLAVAARSGGLPPAGPLPADVAAAASSSSSSSADPAASGLEALDLAPLEFAAAGPAATRAGADLTWCPPRRACFEIPYPPSGPLYVLVAANASGAAPNATWSLEARLARGGCPRACGGRGACEARPGASRGLLWEACACPRPWAGPDCSRAARSPALHALQALLLTATNAAIVPAVLAARRASLPLEAAVFGATGAASAVYHLCDADLACLGLPYGPLQLADFLLSTFDFALAVSLLPGLPPKPGAGARPHLQILLLLALVLAVSADRFGPWPMLVGIVPAALGAAWRALREPWRSRALLGQPGPRRSLLAALALAASAFGVLPLQRDGSYWLLHSWWHVAVMLVPYHVIRAAAALRPPDGPAPDPEAALGPGPEAEAEGELEARLPLVPGPRA